MKVLASIVFFLVCSVTATAQVNNNETEAKLRYVSITTDHGRGSGTVIATGLVSTNYHVFAEDPKSAIHLSGSLIPSKYTHGETGKILATDPKRDLMIVSVKTKEVASLPIGNLALGQSVYCVSMNFMNHKHIDLVHGVVSVTADSTEDQITKEFTDADFGTTLLIFNGFSGSGVFHNGELVGIVRGGYGSNANRFGDYRDMGYRTSVVVTGGYLNTLLQSVQTKEKP